MQAQINYLRKSLLIIGENKLGSYRYQPSLVVTVSFFTKAKDYIEFRIHDWALQFFTIFPICFAYDHIFHHVSLLNRSNSDYKHYNCDHSWCFNNNMKLGFQFKT